MAGGLAAGGGGAMLALLPQAEAEFWGRGAACLASILTGTPAPHRIDAGWALLGSGQAMAVTAACSGTSYFLIVATVISVQLARRGLRPAAAALIAWAGAALFSIVVNALRIVALGQVHRWAIPRFPDGFAHFLHLLVGVSIFLPALIALNLFLEFYGSSQRPRAT